MKDKHVYSEVRRPSKPCPDWAPGCGPQASGSPPHLRHEVRASISWNTALEAVCSLARDGKAEYFALHDAKLLEVAARNIRGKLAQGNET